LFQAEDGIRVFHVTGVQTCALPISSQTLSNYLQEQDLAALEAVPAQLIEIGGAMMFLNAEQVRTAFVTTAAFIKKRFELSTALCPEAVHHALIALARVVMMFNHTKNKLNVSQTWCKSHIAITKLYK